MARDCDQHDRADVVRSSGQGVVGAEPHSSRSVPFSRPEDFGLRRAQQRDRQHRAPSGAKEIGRPGSAIIRDRAGENRRRRRAEPGEEAELADISGIALGELGD
jgi:hypothetical protein